MLVLPSIFHGVIGIIIMSFLAISIFAFPAVFAEESQTWKVKIMKGAGDLNPSHTFYPDVLPVAVGDSIEWVNEDIVMHSITSGIPEHPDYYGYFFNPGDVDPGKSVLFKLENTDQVAFYYLCELHPWMTGKLFIGDKSVAQPETINPISIEKKSFSLGEILEVSGMVHKDFWGSEYQLLIFDPDNSLVEANYGYFADDSSFVENVETVKDLWKKNGKYHLKLVYGVPSKVAQTSFEFNSNTISGEIPIWVKTTGEFWCNNKIQDSEFVNAIEYLIKKEIIISDGENPTSSNQEKIPSWIKSNTCWWADNQISDVDFLSGIEFLINKGTIRI